VVVTPTVPSLRKAAQIIGIWERIGRDSEGVMLVGNRMARKWDLTVQELEAALQRPLSRALPNVPESVNQSVMAGLPLVQHAPRSLMTQHMQSWADELAGRGEPRGKETLWQRLMNR
jgi:pilus assembly protein CpaE